MALDIVCQMQYIEGTMTNEELREIRGKLGMTQQQLAALLGYSGALQISSYERAKNPRPVPQLLELLMRAYDEGYRPKDWPIKE